MNEYINSQLKQLTDEEWKCYREMRRFLHFSSEYGNIIFLKSYSLYDSQFEKLKIKICDTIWEYPVTINEKKEYQCDVVRHYTDLEQEKEYSKILREGLYGEEETFAIIMVEMVEIVEGGFFNRSISVRSARYGTYSNGRTNRGCQWWTVEEDKCPPLYNAFAVKLRRLYMISDRRESYIFTDEPVLPGETFDCKPLFDIGDKNEK